eukprot:CAMPEP_0178390474 /NCGR_PEP_ID=MMETSP0689_2-20121128/10665_1 /TAXON_ID=160604 /ORGANISM="Amphidinium massartii, Strain CS-259" /LENGTH=70 /DNA_ID=CAMNT_0020010985 /DNA_START=1062 /DNA_END=1271 /DNA_ORIENTATION=-
MPKAFELGSVMRAAPGRRGGRTSFLGEDPVVVLLESLPLSSFVVTLFLSESDGAEVLASSSTFSVAFWSS